MTTILLALNTVLLTTGVAIAAAAAAATRGRGPLARRPPLLGRRCVVNTRRPDDQTLLGTVARAPRGWLRLVEAEHIAGDGARRTIDGDVLVERVHVSSIQREPAEPAPTGDA